MEKINFENLPNTGTPINKENLNKMQDNIEKSCVVVSPTQPTTNEKVWIKKGKNLINIINMLKGYSSATVLEKESNRVVIQGTASTYQYMQLQIKLNPGTYTFQRKWRLASGIAGDSTGIVLANKVSDNSTIFELSKNTTNITFEITEETEIAIYFYLSMNISLTDIVKIEIYDIQLEPGSTATEYEEYIEKKIYCKNDNGVFEEFINAETMGIETIKNENGTATKFPDGTMICTLDTAVTDQAINTSYGSIYIGSRTWTFPVPFISRPVASCGAFRWGTSASWGSTGQPTLKNVDIRAFDFFPRESGTSCSLQVTAIGRWK